MIDRLGHRPEYDGANGLWTDAAARLVQYEVAFGGGDRGLVSGSRWNTTPADASARAADEACARFDRAVGRATAIEPPHIDFGISL